jgi:hypothetical protein
MYVHSCAALQVIDTVKEFMPRVAGGVQQIFRAKFSAITEGT